MSVIPLAEANPPAACVGSAYMPHSTSHLLCAGGEGRGAQRMTGSLDTSDLGRHTLPREECRDGKDTFYFSAAGAYLICVLLLSSLC